MSSLSEGCGKTVLSPEIVQRLQSLGQALDRQQQLCVFDGGFVGFENEPLKKENEHGSQRRAQRPPAGSRPGQRASTRSRRGKAGEADYFSSEAHERAFGIELRTLARHYDALNFEDKHGLWVVVTSYPLGGRGPQVTFIIGILADRRVSPRTWAFSRLGPRSAPFPLKHTNFPDASVCAFHPDDEAWEPLNGITAFADHLSIWAVKSLHRQELGWWPGPQFGHGALYRRNEFVAKEWCGCRSGKRYRECHQTIDALVDEKAAEAEFESAFGGGYAERMVPRAILDFARSRLKNRPSLQEVFSARPLKVDFPDLAKVP